jgi:hypothetical protein
MKGVSALFLLIVGMSLSAAAQVPKFDIGFGYSYSRMGAPTMQAGMAKVNMHGIQIDFARNVNRWVGLTAEFTEHYHCITGCWTYGSFSRNEALTSMVGPRLNIPVNSKYKPWLHGLAGFSHLGYSDDLHNKTSSSGSAFAAGGGLDYAPEGSRFAFQIAQVDWFRSNAYHLSRDTFRVSVGMKIRLGTLKKR